MINTNLVYASIFAFGTMLLIIMLVPNLDISFSKLFYSTKDGFIYYNNIVVRLLFKIVPIITKLLFITIFLYIIYLIVRYRSFKIAIISGGFYVILVTAIGPGLVVNYIFKENFGRARPLQIKEFNGIQKFTVPFSISNECLHNCSFSSGHAAMGYSLTSLAYIPSFIFFSRIYSMALIFGTLIGLSRILMGAHFLSDVLASGFVILIINHLLYLCWQKVKSI